MEGKPAAKRVLVFLKARVTLLLPLPTDHCGTLQRASSAYFSSGHGGFFYCAYTLTGPRMLLHSILVRKEFSLPHSPPLTTTLGSPLHLRCSMRYNIRSLLLNSPPSHRWRLLSLG